MADVPGADDLGFELVPPAAPGIEAAAELEAAVAALVDDPDDPQAVATAAPEPFGVSWAFDFDAGRFVRQGRSPTRVTGTDALIQWCLTAIHSARFTHPIFSDTFGMERPNAELGKAIPDELIVDVQDRIRDALLVHDRIVDVEIEGGSFDATSGVLTIGTLTVVTDEEDALAVDDIPIPLEG